MTWKERKPAFMAWSHSSLNKVKQASQEPQGLVSQVILGSHRHNNLINLQTALEIKDSLGTLN